MTDSTWRTSVQHAARDLLGSQNERSAQAAGWEPGDFAIALLNAMMRADAENLHLLGIGFPAYSWAVNTWKNGLDGYDVLHHAAGWAVQ